jgi:hypothetical protein
MKGKIWKIKVAAREVSVTETDMDGYTREFAFANGVKVMCIRGAAGFFRLTCHKHRNPKCEHLRIIRRLVASQNPRQILI